VLERHLLEVAHGMLVDTETYIDCPYRYWPVAQVPGRRSPSSRSDRNIPSRRCCMRFSYRIVPEVYQLFWAGMAAGEFINDAAVAAGSYRKQGTRWLAAAGGVSSGPRPKGPGI
jgi:hypothetical protein